MPEQAPLSQKGNGIYMDLQQSQRLAIKKQVTNKPKTPNNLGLKQFSKTLLQKWDFCLHQTCQKTTAPSWPVCDINHGTQLLPDLDPRCQKSLPEKKQKKCNGKWQGGWNEWGENTQHIIWRKAWEKRQRKLPEYPGGAGVSWTHCCQAQTGALKLNQWARSPTSIKNDPWKLGSDKILP